MSNTYTTVLIDTVSIQDYIFSSNRLKENLGASYIIESKIDEAVNQVLVKIFGDQVNTNWKQRPEQLAITSTNHSAEIGYIGGGNTLLLFKEKSKATEFIKAFSTELLIRYPGVRTAFGIHEDFNLNDFQTCQRQLADHLAQNKSMYFRQTTIPKHGITADCPHSNEVAEHPSIRDNNYQYISTVVKVKQNIADEAHNAYNHKWKNILGDRFLFPKELDDLGQPDEQRYIAIVHIDGNNIGKEFQQCTSLHKLRALSLKVNQASEQAMKKLIENIVSLFPEGCLQNKEGKKDIGFKLKSVDELKNSWFLPIRPIITAGDDITFVCEGRLGVYLAERFVHFLQNPQNGEKPIKSCAGIAIVKAKYPFARAYHLAEELTMEAKKKSREDNDGCYLDFLISSSGFSGNLEHIRKQQFKTHSGTDLHFGPYKLDGQDEKSFKHLKNGLKELQKWPRSKVMALRETIMGSDADRKLFIKDAKAAGLALPVISGYSYHENIVQDSITPYFEMIELMGFYPKLLLES